MEEAFGLEACAGRTVLGFMWFPFGLAGSGFEFEFGVLGYTFHSFVGVERKVGSIFSLLRQLSVCVCVCVCETMQMLLQLLQLPFGGVAQLPERVCMMQQCCSTFY